MSNSKQQRFLQNLLQILLAEKYGEAFVGDIWELYEKKSGSGKVSAKIWLFSQIMTSIPALLKKNLFGSVEMFKNYFLMAFRNLQRHRAYTLISIFGLAIGLSAAILILNYLQFERSYDRFHADADRIYRVAIRHIKEGNIESESHVFTPPIGEDMKKNFPEVEDFVRMTGQRPGYFNVDNTVHKESGVRYASEDFFQVFSFKLRSGDPQYALKDPFSIVLTEKTAQRIFGEQNPLGEAIKIGSQGLFTVTGIAEDPPDQSSIPFNSLLSFSTLYELPGMHMGWNGGNQYITYIRLQSGTDPKMLEEKFPPFLWTYINETIAAYGWKNEAYLQPLKDIHFFYDYGSRTALANFYTFSAIAVFILLIACINFINLTTARAARRAREVGMRKVIGAHRGNLIRQFLGESVTMTCLSFIVGLGFVILLTPTYNSLLDKDLSFFAGFNLVSLMGLVALIVVVGIAAGVYPAFYLSSFQPVKTLKGMGESGRGKKRFQNILVVFQFAISVALIICTLLIQGQLSFIKQVELGYDRDNMIVVRLNDQELRSKTEEIRTELLTLHGIIQVTASSDVPHRGFTGNGYVPEGYTKSIMIRALDVDDHFLETFGIEMVSGRNFSREFSTDKEGYLINETLARQLNWTDPVGKMIYRNQDRQVIGVVKDFQFATLHNNIAPLLITNNPWGNRFNFVSIKTHSQNLPQTLAEIEKIFKGFSPLNPFEFFFLDDAFNRLYRSEERFQRIFLYFSMLAICIALLGLFSLSAYSAQQKSKEIGIRKVLGASTLSIWSIFSREMIGLILGANILAWPAALYVINRWQENFAYRSPLALYAFVLALLGSLLAALLTISIQSLKAAFKDPVTELRNE